LSGKLNSYLADIDQQVQERLVTIIRQMADVQGITEALKAPDSIAWIGKINKFKAAVRETIKKTYAHEEAKEGVLRIL